MRYLALTLVLALAACHQLLPFGSGQPDAGKDATADLRAPDRASTEGPAADGARKPDGARPDGKPPLPDKLEADAPKPDKPAPVPEAALPKADKPGPVPEAALPKPDNPTPVPEAASPKPEAAVALLEASSYCGQLESQYQTALLAAKACSSALAVLQCTQFVDERLYCPCSGTFVNKFNTTEIAKLNGLKTTWSKSSCAAKPGQCLMIKCMAPPTSAVCSAGTCVDQIVGP